MTNTKTGSGHHNDHLREDLAMHPHLAIAFRLAHERQSEARAAAARHRDRAPHRSLRHHVGQSLIRLGRRLAPELHHEPAWSR
jgi:hypothetical protein